jgi:hypothetical protein
MVCANRSPSNTPLAGYDLDLVDVTLMRALSSWSTPVLIRCS